MNLNSVKIFPFVLLLAVAMVCPSAVDARVLYSAGLYMANDSVAVDSVALPADTIKGKKEQKDESD